MGNNTKNIIEINGKRYDSVTGSYLGNSPSAAQANVRSIRGRSVDGFARVSRDAAPAALAPMPVVHKPVPQHVLSPAQKAGSSPLAAARPAANRKPHTAGISTSAHSPQRATTLMRSAVKKPIIKSPTVIKAQTRTDILAKVPEQSIVPKLSAGSVDPARHRRAERMIKHPAINRYASNNTAVVTTFAPLTSLQPVARPLPAPTHPQSTRLRPVSAQARPHHTDLRPAAARLQTPARSASNDLFEQALAHAVSHEQTYDHPKSKTRKKSRFLRAATGSLVALMLVGAIAYFKAPDISLMMASNKAGFDAKLPTTKPVGYTFGHLSYEPGNVIVNFRAEDSKQFNITQKASDWDSQALLNNFVTSVGSAYQTYQRAGRTVYLYGNNTATWVDNGVWYTVDGNSSLTSKQLLELAGSM